MTLNEFQTLIRGKLFVELTSVDAVSSFTDISDPSIRNSATTEGVLVFLPSINKIFARGTYYGINGDDWDSLAQKVSELDQTIQSMGTPLANLATIVGSHTQTLSEHADSIEENTKILNGDSSIQLPNEDDPTYTQKLVQKDGLISRVITIQRDIQTITGGPDGITGVVNGIVDERINDILSGEVQDVTLDSTTIKTSSSGNTTIYQDISTLNSSLSDLSSQVTGINTNLNNKVDTSTYENLLGVIGNINDWDNEENKTIISVVNNLSGDISDIRNDISGIPHFSIEVVQEDPNTKLPNVNNPSKSTIYLALSPEDEQEGNLDLYTEWIYISKTIVVHNEETNQDETITQDSWEKLGRQAFKMTNYLDKTQIESLINPLKTYIDSIKNSFDAEKAAQIETNKNDISDLKTTISNIQNSLNTLIENGTFKLTGQNIKTTSANDSQTIAEDIQSLKTGKLDTTVLNWVIIDSDIDNENEPEQTEP